MESDMGMTKRVQAARKEAQEKRLNAKGKKGYPEFYANQPLQKVKAAANEEIRKAKQSAKDAAEDLEVAEITGEKLEAAQEAAMAAYMLVAKLEAGKRTRTGVSLTARGDN
jgi:hypothetical protein